MKHHIFLGIHESRKTACILTCLLPFDQLDANDLSSQDFRHDSTNWNGCDDISRTLKLRNLRLTGRNHSPQSYRLPRCRSRHGPSLQLDIPRVDHRRNY